MKARLLLDTSVLLRHWHYCRKREVGVRPLSQAKKWAAALIALHHTDAIATPVQVEMIAGVTSQEVLQAAKAFLDQFECVDGQHIPEADWRETLRLAQRTPKDGRPRQLGDCLIRAIANRLRYKVITFDKAFPL